MVRIALTYSTQAHIRRSKECRLGNTYVLLGQKGADSFGAGQLEKTRSALTYEH